MPAPSYHPIGPNRYQLNRTPKMHADAVFYANEAILPLVTRDRSLEQLEQTAELPDLVSPVLGMPDMHEGYGIPVGGVMATTNIVSAGCVGMDINCGVRLLRTDVDHDPALFTPDRLKELVRRIEAVIPVGLGGQHRHQHQGLALDAIIRHGARALVTAGYGTPDDLTHCEEEGAIAGASPQAFSPRATKRARKQIGTLGSGNHFLELQRVTKILDQDTADVFGLKENQLCFMIHSGSRALGHQTCLDFVRQCQRTFRQSRPELVPTRDLASAPVDTDLGRQYLSAMHGAINFAFANRQMMAHQFRQVFTEFMRQQGRRAEVELVYDVAHNSAKWEAHRNQKVLVHRKGATRALPSGHPDNPKTYKNTGHPAFVPGSMGTPSYVLVGTAKSAETYHSVNHGAGRAMSRSEAKKRFKKADFERQMGRVVFNKPASVIADEAPEAYKDVDAVIDTLEEISITRRVARLEPLAVIKGD